MTGRASPWRATASLVALLSWREWRHHPWRHAAALLAVALGVALAYSVHLINRSALAEFASAVRAANGDADLTLRSGAGGDGLPDALFDRIATDPGVALASPVLEIDTYARGPEGRRVAVRVLGLDLLRAGALAPALVPRPAAGEDRLVMLDPQAVFANAAAREALALADGQPVPVMAGGALQPLRLAGSVALGGAPLLVMDIAGAQERFGRLGRLSRIDLRLAPGTARATLLARWNLPAGVEAAEPTAGEQRVSNLSRAYRVNLTVLALVALLVGAFLVFSVVSLSVAQRQGSFALLGVLGLAARERGRLVLAECALLGLAGSVLGLLAGLGLAAAALRWMAGDLGGGYFPGIAPALQVDVLGTAVFGALGVAAAVAGGWWPARRAAALPPAQALKGLGTLQTAAPPRWPALLMLAAGTALAFAPPIAGLPLAAYAAVALLLVGGVALVPGVVHALLALVRPGQGALARLALLRARHQRHTATAAVSGVVASLALSVAITVMVSSFRDGVSRWLDDVLPADLYARTAGSSSAADQAWLPAGFAATAAALPGVLRVEASRSRALALHPSRPSVALVARPFDPTGDPPLPLLAAPLPAPPGAVGVFVSEAMVTLYAARPGGWLGLPLEGATVQVFVRGVWRDYARQFGAVVMAERDYRALTGDTRINDLALWLAPGAGVADVQQALRAALPDPSLLEFMGSRELRELSLRIFDRSFAVTTYLQAVAIAIGLVGIAASLSAQVLARRKEFGLLAHLGLTRAQVVAVVAGEAAAWVAAGVLMGLALGVAISLVLVFVVNPQSFHWTMELVLPAARLAALAGAVLASGVATAALAARHAASAPAVRAVKEDW